VDASHAAFGNDVHTAALHAPYFLQGATMSLAAASTIAYQRRADTPRPNPGNLPQLEEAVGGQQGSTNSVTSALSAIATYIPSEILTLYVAVIAAQTPAQGLATGMAPGWLTLVLFAVATPLVVWVLYATKVGAANKPLPIVPTKWPVWEMASATIAFLAWSFAMPQTPFGGQTWYSAPLAGIAVLVVSTSLGLVAPLFTKRALT